MLELIWFWTSQAVVRFWAVRRVISSCLFPSHSPLKKARVDFFQNKRIMLPFSALCSLGYYTPLPYPSKILETWFSALLIVFLVVSSLWLCCSDSISIYQGLFNLFLNSWKNIQDTGADRVTKPTSVATITLCISYEQQQKHDLKQVLFTKWKFLPTSKVATEIYISDMSLSCLASKTYKLQHLITGRSATNRYGGWARLNQSQAKFY